MHGKQQLAWLLPALLFGVPPWFSLPAETLPCGFVYGMLKHKGAKLPAPLQLDTTSTASQTTLLINWHADFPLHPTKERSITQDWRTKASFLSVICSLDTKSTPNAASSISVIETKHCELKIGDRSSATRAAGGGGGNPHLNQQHWWLLIVPRRAWRGTVSQENKDGAQRCSSWGRGAAHNLVNSLQALRFERRLCKDKLRVWSLPCYTLAFPRITPLGWADQIQSAFTWNHRLAMGFGSDHKNSVLKCHLFTAAHSEDLRTTDNLTELLKSIRHLSYYRLQHRREWQYLNYVLLALTSSSATLMHRLTGEDL